MREENGVERHSDVTGLSSLLASQDFSPPHPVQKKKGKNAESGGTLARPSLRAMPQVEMILFLFFIIGMCVYGQDPASKVVSDRYAVYWNRTNPR